MLLVSRISAAFKSSAFLESISMAALKVEKLSVIRRMYCFSRLDYVSVKLSVGVICLCDSLVGGGDDWLFLGDEAGVAVFI